MQGFNSSTRHRAQLRLVNNRDLGFVLVLRVPAQILWGRPVERIIGGGFLRTKSPPRTLGWATPLKAPLLSVPAKPTARFLAPFMLHLVDGIQGLHQM